MSENGFSWVTSPEVFIEGWIKHESLIREQSKLMMQYYSDRITAWMRTNATWQDQTGDARRDLRAEVVVDGDQIQIHLLHAGSPEDVALELAHAGRYSILAPAMDFWAPKIMESMKQMMSG